MDILTGVFFFAFGYFYNEYVSQKERENLKSQLLEGFYKTCEIASYTVMGSLGKMHDNGLKALELVSGKCVEDDDSKQEEYAKIAEVFDRKMNEFGEVHMRTLKKYIPYKMKYNTYKEVKENFSELINNKSEDNNNAWETIKTINQRS